MADYPAPESIGALSMTCNSTSAQYPSDGVGGSTATAGSSTVLTASLCTILGYTLNVHAALSHLILLDGAGNTIDTYNIPDATQVGVFQPFSPLGMRRAGAFGFKLSGAGGEYIIWYAVNARA